MSNQKNETDYPNVGQHLGGEKTLNPDNYFKGKDIELLRKKYLQFTVYFESLVDVLELNRQCSVEEFGIRIRDLVYAANQEKDDEIS